MPGTGAGAAVLGVHGAALGLLGLVLGLGCSHLQLHQCPWPAPHPLPALPLPGTPRGGTCCSSLSVLQRGCPSAGQDPALTELGCCWGPEVVPSSGAVGHCA